MNVRVLLLLALLCGPGVIARGQQPAFRTDGGDEKLPWYQLQPGEFPPAGSAHAISGELIGIDHVNRAGILRQDRTSAQRTDEYDRPLPFAMLPFGAIYYHGAPAELRDIPIGTHLHGEFYQAQQNGKPVFCKVLKLADDFSHDLAAKRLWKVEAIDVEKGTLTARRVGADGQTDDKPTLFQIRKSTNVWKGRGFGELSQILPGDEVLLNLTVCTLKGPGRCLDIWLDAESRDFAAARQREVHRLYQHEHGLACRVDEVDNPNHIVTVTLFGGIDPTLLESFRVGNHIAAAVAEETLRTHDQINDVKRGPIREVQQVPIEPGSSGVRLRFHVNELLEGYRPQRILRLFGNGWRVDDLPREESAYDG